MALAASRNRWLVLLPYVIALAAQLPLLLHYFSTLWGRPHYQFFPFALIMVAAFAAIRWPRQLESPFFSRKLSGFLFWVGVLLGIAAALFSHSWFSAASMVALLTSLFSRTWDGEVEGKTLLVLGLPLLIVLMPPNNLDFWVITELQQTSARISSWYLDILNFKHFSPGTTLNFPDHQYEVERACSGVQSFFTLLFCTSFLIVAFRRPFLRSLLLLISAGFWAIFMNSVRILMIPIADIQFGIDLTHGLPHDLLGYAAMLIAVLMILSTDQLLEFLFAGRRETVDSEPGRNWFQRTMLRRSADGSSRQGTVPAKPVSALAQRLAIAGSIVVLLLGSMQFYDFARSVTRQNVRVRAFSTNVIVDVNSQAMPQVVTSTVEGEEVSWTQVKYDRTDRTIGSDFGQRSDLWLFRSQDGGIVAQASLDQTFPGWHELITCYRNIGWQVNPGARIKRNAEFTNERGETIDWSYIECEMTDPTTNQQGYLLFSFSDATGTPFDAPIDWGNLRSFLERAKNRLFHSLRATLFRGEAYQMQVFVQSATPLDQVKKEQIRGQYLEIRNAMRQALLKYGDDSDLADSGVSAASETPLDNSQASQN